LLLVITNVDVVDEVVSVDEVVLQTPDAVALAEPQTPDAVVSEVCGRNNRSHDNSLCYNDIHDGVYAYNVPSSSLVPVHPKR